MSRPWGTGLFDCFNPFTTCLLGTCCPCILYGQITEKKDDPLRDPSGVNGSCCGWYALSCCGLQCILQMSTRREIRAKHNIEGSPSTDFLLSWCCPCCSLIQEYKEVDAQKHATGGAVGYTPQQGGMTYATPA